jgi:hypothetical protein
VAVDQDAIASRWTGQVAPSVPSMFLSVCMCAMVPIMCAGKGGERATGGSLLKPVEGSTVQAL